MNIIFEKQAAKYISSLDRPTKQRLRTAINRLPSGDVKKLQGYSNEYRLRVGNYRILFSFGPNDIIIKVILPRGEVYKNL